MQAGVPEIGKWIKTSSGRCGRVIKNECRSNNPIDRGKVIPGLFLFQDYEGKTWFGMSLEWDYDE